MASMHIPLYQPVFHLQPQTVPSLNTNNSHFVAAQKQQGDLIASLDEPMESLSFRATPPPTGVAADPTSNTDSDSDNGLLSEFDGSGNTETSCTSVESDDTESELSSSDEDYEGEQDGESDDETNSSSDDDNDIPETAEELLASLQISINKIGVEYICQHEAQYSNDFYTDESLVNVLQGVNSHRDSYSAAMKAYRKVLDAGEGGEEVFERIRTITLDSAEEWWELDSEEFQIQGRAKFALLGQFIRVGIVDGGTVSSFVSKYAEDAHHDGLMNVLKTLFYYAGPDICGPEYAVQTQEAVERLRRVHDEWGDIPTISRAFRQIESRVQMYTLQHELAQRAFDSADGKGNAMQRDEFLISFTI
ncbi:hypothetical protein EW145_g5542 [Phellinidium pouzarii]|uniref:Uncharacterized protein n=1 Tax=Phellinidium pouzarii TaxID=167371 RepID=A0A4S4L1G7_9AGAM|nr:hypothetical protein EW145_g5542 [Phellinidium pouzarii]